jgi:hypothetical protein
VSLHSTYSSANVSVPAFDSNAVATSVNVLKIREEIYLKTVNFSVHTTLIFQPLDVLFVGQ